VERLFYFMVNQLKRLISVLLVSALLTEAAPVPSIVSTYSSTRAAPWMLNRQTFNEEALTLSLAAARIHGNRVWGIFQKAGLLLAMTQFPLKAMTTGVHPPDSPHAWIIKTVLLALTGIPFLTMVNGFHGEAQRVPPTSNEHDDPFGRDKKEADKVRMGYFDAGFWDPDDRSMQFNAMLYEPFRRDEGIWNAGAYIMGERDEMFQEPGDDQSMQFSATRHRPSSPHMPAVSVDPIRTSVDGDGGIHSLNSMQKASPRPRRKSAQELARSA
jgi:hypothetical protein